ncbi:MAG: CHAD domain-containing protein [Thermoanaerobaculia bacterium]
MEELKQIALELLDDALRRLRSRSARLRARNVHETRKRLKELRAIVRLLDSGDRGRWISRLFRNVGRELSASREADSALETFAKLRRKLDPAEFQRIRDRLAAQIVVIDLRVLRTRVAAAREEIARWPAGKQPPRQFDRRLLRTYRSARRRMARAVRTRTASDFHQWRKRAKEQWYQTRLLADVVPELQGRERRLHELSRTLGSHHDLMLLREAIARHEDDLDAAACARVIEIASDKSAELEQKAIAIGAALFLEPPRLWMPRPGESRRIDAASAILTT